MNALVQAWWQARNETERRTLALGGLGLALLLCVGLVILPVVDQHRALAQRLPVLRASTALLEMQAQEALALRARAGSAAPPGAAATGPGGVAGLRATLESAGLHTAGDSVQAQGDGHVELRLASANFDAFLVWLARTRTETGLGVLSLEAEALEAPGMVRLHCVMAPAGVH